MRADDEDRRATLVARKEAALKRWPGRSGPEFEAELETVARELDRLARALDDANAQPIDRLRAWSATGEAYLLLSAKYALQCATEAFRCAEAAAARAETDARELMQLKHQYGLALLKLGEDRSEQLAAEAANRLSTALALARKHMPVGVASIKFELFRAEHTVTTLRDTRRGEQRAPHRTRETEVA